MPRTTPNLANNLVTSDPEIVRLPPVENESVARPYPVTPYPPIHLPPSPEKRAEDSQPARNKGILTFGINAQYYPGEDNADVNITSRYIRDKLSVGGEYHSRKNELRADLTFRKGQVDIQGKVKHSEGNAEPSEGAQTTVSLDVTIRL